MTPSPDRLTETSAPTQTSAPTETSAPTSTRGPAAPSAPSPEPDQRALRLAKAFDLRTFIGALFLIFGVVVTVEGLRATPAAIAKAGGIRLSLWTGLAMFAIGVVFVVWMLVRPPAAEAEHQDLSHAPERRHG